MPHTSTNTFGNKHGLKLDLRVLVCSLISNFGASDSFLVMKLLTRSIGFLLGLQEEQTHETKNKATAVQNGLPETKILPKEEAENVAMLP